MKCSQEKCNNEATCRVFWPGKPPLLSCKRCAEKARAFGEAIECYIHVEWLTPDQVLQMEETPRTERSEG